MKKIFIIISIIISIFGSLCATGFADKNNDNYDVKVHSFKNSVKNSIKESNEDLYKNMFLAIIYPHVQKAITNYYDKYFSYLPGEDPWSFKFLKIERKQGTNYTFTIVLDVTPYVGPHISVGRDRITLKVDLSGVIIEKFEHLESYELPPHYQNIIKTKWPPK